MDDEDFDDLFGMSEAELGAEADREMRAYAQWYDSLPLERQISHCRWRTLESCRSARKLIRIPTCPDIIRDDAKKRLKGAQVRLLKIRTWRASGIHPGEA